MRREALRDWTAAVVISGLGGVLIFFLVDDFPLWETVLAGALFGLFVGTGLTIMHRFANRTVKPS